MCRRLGCLLPGVVWSEWTKTTQEYQKDGQTKSAKVTAKPVKHGTDFARHAYTVRHHLGTLVLRAPECLNVKNWRWWSRPVRCSMLWGVSIWPLELKGLTEFLQNGCRMSMLNLDWYLQFWKCWKLNLLIWHSHKSCVLCHSITASDLHLLKSVCNNFKKRDLQFKEHSCKWQDIVDFRDVDSKLTHRLAPKLSR